MSHSPEVSRKGVEHVGQRLRASGALLIARVLPVVECHGNRIALPRGFLLRDFDRRRADLAAGELLDRREQARLVGREVLSGGGEAARRQHRRQIRRPDMCLDELDRVLAHRLRALRRDVQGVEHEDEHAPLINDVVGRDIGRSLQAGSSWTRQGLRDRYSFECGDPLRHAAFENPEIGLLQIADDAPVGIARNDSDLDKLDSAPE
ncbi:MAG TPA: hypothetical protein VH458_01115 [Vicinamibacterales bacterium]